MNERTGKLTLKDCPAGGCGAKLGPSELADCLAGLPARPNADLLVGFDESDDAAVYRLSEKEAIVSTADFFPPMVDDPRTFGRIAAANALSDVYAMGGTPLCALNLVCFPRDMDKGILREILAGGAEKAAEAGVAIAGGHSIYDSGLKYGLAVTGRIDPGRILRNNACREGDCLILTKPLGTGLILSAAGSGLAAGEEIAAAVSSMERLNKYAAEILSSFPVNAATDVTGFGLLAHAAEMAGTDWTLTMDFDSLPLLPGALAHAEAFLATAAGERNRLHLGARADVSGLPPAAREVLFDPQTSGGLLVSLPEASAAAACRALRESGADAAVVGQVTRRDGPVVAAV